MPHEAMPVESMTDARSSPSAVWKMLENLKGEELTAWRMAEVKNRATAAERNLLEPFPFGWFAVCYGDELAIGEVKPVRYFARELVVWRGADGKARVLDAHCRHLGAHMGYGGRVSGNDIACPFHAWQYNELGAVTHIPYAKTTPPQAKRDNCVRSYPVVERNGFVLIWYHPDKIAPLYEVDTYSEVGSPEWTPLRKYEWRVFTSMRNMHDNAVDLAHFHYVHRTAQVPDSEITFDGHRVVTVARSKLGTPRGFVDGAIISDSAGPGTSSVRFQGISETLMVSSVVPVEADQLHVRFAFTQPMKESEGPMAGLAKALIRDICKQLDQDKTIWDRQRYESDPLMCDGDGPIPEMRLRFDQFLSVSAFEKSKSNKRRLEIKRKT
jgi:phenylpropionate dioxygenase-like ring-hydroxylating dioxygenase large terminal subunit